MSAAKFCRSVRVNRSTLSHDSVTCSRSPEVSSIALHAQPLDLWIYTSIDVGFAIIGPFARQRRPPIQFLFIGSRVSSTLLSGLASRLIPCAFAITSPPSGCDEDFPLQAIDPARHTKNDGGQDCWPPLKIRVQCFSKFAEIRVRPEHSRRCDCRTPTAGHRSGRSTSGWPAQHPRCCCQNSTRIDPRFLRRFRYPTRH